MSKTLERMLGVGFILFGFSVAYLHGYQEHTNLLTELAVAYMAISFTGIGTAICLLPKNKERENYINRN